MLDLKKDTFVRLAISAQKNTNLNKPFRIAHEDFKTIVQRDIEKNSKKFVDVNPGYQVTELSPIETKVNDVKVSNVLSKDESDDVQAVHIYRKDKIDETVEKIVNDPQIAEIKIELEFAQGLLRKIKSVDSDNPKIPVIEQTISRLQLMLDQKSYV